MNFAALFYDFTSLYETENFILKQKLFVIARQSGKYLLKMFLNCYCCLLLLTFLVTKIRSTSATPENWDNVASSACLVDSRSIELIVSNLSDIEATIKFVKLLPKRNQICEALEMVFNKMKETHGFLNPQALQLAYEIKSAHDKETSQSLIATYEALKWSFPENIRAIAWSGKVKLRNVLFDEYLYAPGDSYALDNDRRNIFTWIDATYKGDDTTALWKFETDDGIHFYIKSLRYDEYLYAAAIDYDTKRRQVYIWRPKNKDTTMRWKIEIISDDRIVLRYPHQHNEYLFSSYNKSDNYRRFIFTWKPQDATQRSPQSDGWFNVIAA